ncbi:MAG: sigma-70 family RNA polymerase sigma factor [Phycisphaerales bacterium]|nr:sigma-70 family RNA polymerase sigma factor [Phycisphaerales bacterium]
MQQSGTIASPKPRWTNNLAGEPRRGGILIAPRHQRPPRDVSRTEQGHRAMHDQHDQRHQHPQTQPQPRGDDLTQLIEEARVGQADAQRKLFGEVYNELKVIAASYMRSERPEHTLGATALVNESYLRLFGVTTAANQMSYEHRHAFFKAASVAMRRILIDHARAKGSAKRSPGDGKRIISLDLEHAVEQANPADLIALDEALDRLGQEDERSASIVQLRFYAGRQIEEIAQMLGLSARTVKRDWEFARARLQQLLDTETQAGDPAE